MWDPVLDHTVICHYQSSLASGTHQGKSQQWAAQKQWCSMHWKEVGWLFFGHAVTLATSRGSLKVSQVKTFPALDFRKQLWFATVQETMLHDPLLGLQVISKPSFEISRGCVNMLWICTNLLYIPSCFWSCESCAVPGWSAFYNGCEWDASMKGKKDRWN